MNGNIDKRTEEMMRKAVENAKSFSQRMEEYREKRLWKKVNIPCSLHETLRRLTKDELDRIRKNYDFKKLSALKKEELAAELADLIPLKYRNIIYALDQSRYDFIKMIIRNSGVISDMDIPVTNAEAFMRYSMAFPGIHKDEKVLFIPVELINVFTRTDGSELESVIRRNTEWIRLTFGMLYYYGVMEAELIKEKLDEITGKKVDLAELIKVISFASDFYGQVDKTRYGYKDERVFDAEYIVKEHNMRPEVDYYPFTKKQLLKAGDPDYVDRTPQMNSFISFLLVPYAVKTLIKNKNLSNEVHQILC